MPRMNRAKLLTIMQQHPDIFGQVLSDIEAGGNPAQIVRLLNIIDHDFQEIDLEILTEEDLKKDDIEINYKGEPRQIDLEDALCYIARIVTKVSVADHPAPQSLTLQGLVMCAKMVSEHTDRTAFVIRLFNPMYQFMLGEYAQDGSTKTIIRKPPAATQGHTEDTHTRPKTLYLPLSKPAKTIFNDPQNPAKDIVSYLVDTASQKEKASGKTVNVKVALNYAGLKAANNALTRLDHFDRDVLNATASTYAAGNKITSPTEIYHIMNGSYKGKPSAEAVNAILDSVRKMALIWLVLDNSEEVEAHGKPAVKSAGKKRLESYLLPVAIATDTINNKETENAIAFLTEPPLFLYSKAVGQLTQIPLELQAYPGKHTRTTDDIFNYLITQIAHMKDRKSFPRRILFETLLKNVTPPKENAARSTISRWRTAAAEAENRILKHLKDKGFIDGFKISAAQAADIILQPKNHPKK